MKKRMLPHLCRTARIFLRCALPLILLVAVVLLISGLQAHERDPVAAGSYYPILAEYIAASVGIVLAGAFLIDRVFTERKENDR